MNWIAFSYSLPSKSSSSPRVALWRRLKRLGAIALAGGVQVLPARDECIEGFHWLAQEIQQAGGEALVLRVDQVDGIPDQQLVALFNVARKEEYDELAAEAAALEQAVADEPQPPEHVRLQDTLVKLRRRHADIARVDYFDSPEGLQVAGRLARIAQALAPAQPTVQIAALTIAAYRESRWVTRPRPHVDRLACAWLIRRFINPTASIRYADTPGDDEVPFDMSVGAFGHQGNFCTFETMLHAFGLTEPTLQAIAEIVHEIDLRDGRYIRPETSGIDAVLAGWQHEQLADDARETRGIALFDGLYAAFASQFLSKSREEAL